MLSTFGDAVFSWDYDLIADGSKARRHGFHRYVDTAEMFTRIFDDMRSQDHPSVVSTGAAPVTYRWLHVRLGP